MEALYYVFNTPAGDHHIVPVAMAVLTTQVRGKVSITYVQVVGVSYEADPTTFLVCTMERALQDRSVWGNDEGHNTTTEIAYARKD